MSGLYMNKSCFRTLKMHAPTVEILKRIMGEYALANGVVN